MAKKFHLTDIVSTASYTRIIRVFLGFLIFVILLGLLGGTIKTFLDLRLLITHNAEFALRQIILNVLILLAVVEILKTTLSYLTDGRVRVTFIVDTVMIVMLNEVISVWFKGQAQDHNLNIVLILLTLIAIRILAIRYSPDDK